MILKLPKQLWGVYMNGQEVIKKIFYAYEEAGLVEGNPLKVLSLIHDQVIGIGMGDQGLVTSKKDIERIMMDTIKKDTSAVYSLVYEDVMVRFQGEASANLCAKVIVNRRDKKTGATSSSSFMQSLGFTFTEGSWFICHLHASPLELSAESIEAYPLVFSDQTLNNLRSQITTEAFDLMSASFVGGVVGVRPAGDKYPLYFANEGIARYLGYTIEEFHKEFHEDVSHIFYSGDYEHAMKLTRDMLENGTDITERLRLQKKDGSLLPVIDCARKSRDGDGNLILIAVFTDISALVELQEKLEERNNMILSSIRYASKIQRNLLPSDSCLKGAFSDYGIVWKPRDIVGGDIYWLKSFSSGVLLVVCDCTGHGIPGALITMLAASALDNIATEQNCRDTAGLMLSVDQGLSAVLNVHTAEAEECREIAHIHDGCDIAILYIDRDGSVTFSSAGIPVFICNGASVDRFKGQRLSVGDGLLTEKDTVRTTVIPPSPRNKCYIATDGLFHQIGGVQSLPFGYRTFEEFILRHHTESLEQITTGIWDAFEAYRGGNSRRDDVELIAFQP